MLKFNQYNRTSGKRTKKGKTIGVYKLNLYSSVKSLFRLDRTVICNCKCTKALLFRQLFGYNILKHATSPEISIKELKTSVLKNFQTRASKECVYRLEANIKYSSTKNNQKVWKNVQF